jgi:hypothetical protein
LKLEGIHVDEEKTINDPELLMEVISFIVEYMSMKKRVSFDNCEHHHKLEHTLDVLNIPTEVQKRMNSELR